MNSRQQYSEQLIETFIKTENTLTPVDTFCYDTLIGHFCFTKEKEYTIWLEDNTCHHYIFDDNQKIYHTFCIGEGDFILK